ncbi:stage II sporulation protein M [Candidatus Woesearchaeota archaeon]|jgi:stage II sporulation protein M|nr:stage II sporulation protein M [Candidatus Woesearchaeota archaeon]
MRKKTKNKSKSIKKYEHEYFAFFKSIFYSHRYLLYVVISFFMLGFIAAFFMPNNFKLQLFDSLALLVESVHTSNSALLTFNIFFNNLYVAVLMSLSGLLLLPPFLLLLSNGLVIGLMFDLGFKLAHLNGFIPIQMVLGIIPHGIFELPALFLSSTLGVAVLLKLIFRKKLFIQFSFWKFARNNLKAFIEIVILLLLIAAIVEVYVTGAFISESLSDSIRIRNESLSAVILDGSNLNELDNVVKINEIDSTKFKKQSDHLLNNARINFMSTIHLVYNPELFAFFSSFVDVQYTTKIHTINENSILSQSVFSFDSKQDASDYLFLLNELESNFNISGFSSKQMSAGDFNYSHVTYNSESLFNHRFIKQHQDNFLLFNIQLENGSLDLFELIISELN